MGDMADSKRFLDVFAIQDAPLSRRKICQAFQGCKIGRVYQWISTTSRKPHAYVDFGSVPEATKALNYIRHSDRYRANRANHWNLIRFLKDIQAPPREDAVKDEMDTYSNGLYQAYSPLPSPTYSPIFSPLMHSGSPDFEPPSPDLGGPSLKRRLASDDEDGWEGRHKLLKLDGPSVIDLADAGVSHASGPDMSNTGVSAVDHSARLSRALIESADELERERAKTRELCEERDRLSRELARYKADAEDLRPALDNLGNALKSEQRRTRELEDELEKHKMREVKSLNETVNGVQLPALIEAYRTLETITSLALRKAQELASSDFS
ncbi:hypothetical protein FRC02_009244 [Tulasnella sp. 418]|nr:hypothetical protein FRC02_009244 [Tulasnella sp. 418]